MKLVLGVSVALVCLSGMVNAMANEKLFVEKAKKNHCYECHRNGERFIGPSFLEIRERYNGQEKNPQFVDYLANKIINGGGGAWSPTPMNSNPQVSKAEAKEIVKLIFKLEKH
jgi:cytochrome c